MSYTEAELISELAKREGKKKELGIGQIKELYGILCDLCYEQAGVQEMLWRRGYQRARNKREKANRSDTTSN